MEITTAAVRTYDVHKKTLKKSTEHGEWWSTHKTDAYLRDVCVWVSAKHTLQQQYVGIATKAVEKQHRASEAPALATEHGG